LEQLCIKAWFEKIELLKIIEAKKVVEIKILNHNGSLINALIINFNR
jgi:hypothetical protein